MRPTPLSHSPARACTRGLTLVEIIVAATISGLVIIATLSVLLQTLKAYSYENGQLNVNLEIRKFTNQLTADALSAAYFKVANSSSDLGAEFSASSYVSSAPAATTSGDCVAFVHKDPADESRFTKIIIYFRAPDARNEGTVRRVEVNLARNGGGAIGPVHSLLPRLSAPFTNYPAIVSLARGLGTNGKLFDLIGDRSLVVNCEIIRAPTGQFRRASRTFSYSVTPR